MPLARGGGGSSKRSSAEKPFGLSGERTCVYQSGRPSVIATTPRERERERKRERERASASYLLLSSLDIARRNLSLNGEQIFDKVIDLCNYAREEINKIDGYYAFSKEIINHKDVYDFDVTKLCVNTKNIGLAGVEVYDLLRDDFGIQIEFGDIYNILAIVSVGDNPFNIERLVASLAEIKRRYKKCAKTVVEHEYIEPIVKATPKEAFFGNKKQVPINEASGLVSGEFVMAYPPGIPIVAPGEVITKEIIDYINYSKEKGSLLLGTEDMKIENIKVLVQ